MIISKLREVPERLATRRQDARRWVKKTVFDAREQGETGLWELGLTAIEQANHLIDRAEKLPVLDRVSDDARGFLASIEKATTHPPLEDYDTLSVRKVMAQLRDLDRFGLLRIARYEAANKNRKTILDAIERETGRRARLAAA